MRPPLPEPFEKFELPPIAAIAPEPDTVPAVILMAPPDPPPPFQPFGDVPPFAQIFPSTFTLPAVIVTRPPPLPEVGKKQLHDPPPEPRSCGSSICPYTPFAAPPEAPLPPGAP